MKIKEMDKILQRYEFNKAINKKTKQIVLIANIMSPFLLDKFHELGVHFFTFSRGKIVFKDLHDFNNMNLYVDYRMHPDNWKDLLPSQNDIVEIKKIEQQLYAKFNNHLINNTNSQWKIIATYLIGGVLYYIKKNIKNNYMYVKNLETIMINSHGNAKYSNHSTLNLDNRINQYSACLVAAINNNYIDGNTHFFKYDYNKFIISLQLKKQLKGYLFIFAEINDNDLAFTRIVSINSRMEVRSNVSKTWQNQFDFDSIAEKFKKMYLNNKRTKEALNNEY